MEIYDYRSRFASRDTPLEGFCSFLLFALVLACVVPMLYAAQGALLYRLPQTITRSMVAPWVVIMFFFLFCVFVFITCITALRASVRSGSSPSLLILARVLLMDRRRVCVLRGLPQTRARTSRGSVDIVSRGPPCAAHK